MLQKGDLNKFSSCKLIGQAQRLRVNALVFKAVASAKITLANEADTLCVAGFKD